MTDEEIQLLQDKLTFVEKEADCLRNALFKQRNKIKELYKQNTELEIKLGKENKKAKSEIAKAIFTEMYNLVCDAENFTIIVNANDIKSIAKRYDVKL